MAENLKIKLNYRQLEGLRRLHFELAAAFRPKTTDPYQVLLAAHLMELSLELDELISNDKASYKWSLSPVQALAICQIWDNVEYNDTDEFDKLALQEVLNAIDKHRKNNQPKLYAGNR